MEGNSDSVILSQFTRRSPNYRSASFNCATRAPLDGRCRALPRGSITTHVATYERLITPARRPAVIDCNCVRRARPGNSCGRSRPVHRCPAFVDGCYAPQPFVRVSVLPCPSPGRASSQMAIVVATTGTIRRDDVQLGDPSHRHSASLLARPGLTSTNYQRLPPDAHRRFM